MSIIVQVVATLSRKLLQSFLMLLVLEVLQAIAKNFPKWVKTFYQICQKLQKHHFFKMQTKRNTFYYQRTNFLSLLMILHEPCFGSRITFKQILVQLGRQLILISSPLTSIDSISSFCSFYFYNLFSVLGL